MCCGLKVLVISQARKEISATSDGSCELSTGCKLLDRPVHSFKCTLRHGSNNFYSTIALEADVSARRWGTVDVSSTFSLHLEISQIRGVGKAR